MTPTPDGDSPSLSASFSFGFQIRASSINADKPSRPRLKNAMNSAIPRPTANTLFYSPQKTMMWDTWVYHHDDTYYLYYLGGPFAEWNNIGLATSHDGVHWKEHGSILQIQDDDVLWMGSGAVWRRPESSGVAPFIMNFSEWRGGREDGRQTIFFAESDDLIHWRRLSKDLEFIQNEAWYESKGRWDNIWAVPNSRGGYYGYWAGTPHERHGVGFGQSDDGVSWQALEPPELIGVNASPEVGAVHRHNDRYYLLAGLDDLESTTARSPAGYFNPGITTLISSNPGGPFAPAPKNRRLLVGNASYFTRFVETPDGVLVNHHSWVIKKEKLGGVDDSEVWLTPFKRACWSADGDALYLKWWEGNDRVKQKPFPVGFAEEHSADQRIDLLNLKSGDCLHAILEGKLELPVQQEHRVGLFIESSPTRGTVFWVLPSGVVEYGALDTATKQFECEGRLDRELFLSGSCRFRVILHDKITEFYLDDYLMQCYSLQNRGDGRVGIIGGRGAFANLTAWYLGD